MPVRRFLTARIRRTAGPALARSLAVAALTALLAAAPALAELQSEAAIRDMITRGETTQAIEASKARIAAFPNEPEPLVLLANAMLTKTTHGKASTLSEADATEISKPIESAIRLAPQRKDLYFGLIELSRMAELDDRMIEQVRRTAAQFPNDTDTMQTLMEYASEKTGGRDQATAAKLYEAIYDAYTKKPEAILAWAAMLVSRGELDRATKVLLAGAEAVPASAPIVSSLADCYVYQRNFRDATKYYGKAAGLDPKGQAARLPWAAAMHTFDAQSARLIAEPLWGGNANGPKVPSVSLSGDAAAKTNTRLTNAGTLLYRAVVKPDLGAMEAFSLARSLAQAGFPAPAIAETEVALSRDAVLPEALALRGEIYAQIGLNAEALEAAKQAEAIFDASGERTFGVTRDEVLSARATYEARLGKTEDAFNTYTRMKDPKRQYYKMALLLERLGRTEEARAHLEKTVATSTDTSEVDAAKARLASDTYRKKP